MKAVLGDAIGGLNVSVKELTHSNKNYLMLK